MKKLLASLMVLIFAGCTIGVAQADENNYIEMRKYGSKKTVMVSQDKIHNPANNKREVVKERRYEKHPGTGAIYKERAIPNSEQKVYAQKDYKFDKEVQSKQHQRIEVTKDGDHIQFTEDGRKVLIKQR